MIFYFSATGNSLYVAKQLDDHIISIPQAIHYENKEYCDNRIGIVAPVYGHEVCQMVKDFMKSSKFNTDYFYMILTYGNRHGGASKLAYDLCDECGIDVKYINVVLMVDNWLPAFDMDEQIKIDKKVDEQLAIITSDINSNKNYISEVTPKDLDAHKHFLENMAKLPSDLWQHLIRISDKCIGCGICASVCPSASIDIIDKVAVYHPGKCQTCFACVHNCPSKAIKLTVEEKNENARYRNKNILLSEIIKANNQKGVNNGSRAI